MLELAQTQHHKVLRVVVEGVHGLQTEAADRLQGAGLQGGPGNHLHQPRQGLVKAAAHQ